MTPSSEAKGDEERLTKMAHQMHACWLERCGVCVEFNRQLSDVLRQAVSRAEDKAYSRALGDALEAMKAAFDCSCKHGPEVTPGWQCWHRDGRDLAINALNVIGKNCLCQLAMIEAHLAVDCAAIQALIDKAKTPTHPAEGDETI